MPPLFKIKEQPEAYWEDKLRKLFLQFKREIEDFKNKAKQDLQEALGGAIFRETELSERTARQEAERVINQFKSEMTERMKNMLDNLDQSRKEILAKAETELSDILLKSSQALENSVARIDSLTPAKGDPGYTPIKETDYFDGEPGPKGDPGKNGDEILPQQIADKLNTTEESVNISVIKGLEPRLRHLGSKTMLGGGGGDTIRYKDLSALVNGVATTFTLTNTARVLGVFSTQSPAGGFRPEVDWTFNATTQVLTLNVSAIQEGQNLWLMYVER